MAIKYFVQSPGSYVAYGLSTDTKPTSPPDDSYFIEVDTDDTYSSSSSVWSLVSENYTTVEKNKLAGIATGATAGCNWGTNLTNIPSTFAPSSHTHPQSEITNLVSDLSGKQPTLVSGTNIKTVNGNPLTGSGDVVISSSAAWGGITGTLSNQTDLVTQLALKAPLTSPVLITPALGTPISGNLANCTFPTLNQNTSGTAGGLSSNITESQVTNLVSDLNLKAPLISPSFTTPNIGAATGTSLATTGAITSSGGGLGYIAGAGGTVTQATSRTTGVTLNKLCGNITMVSAAQAANALVTFTLTNSFIAATDYLLIQHISATNGGAWVFSTVCGAGSATINIRNQTTASITEATPLRFFLLKSVAV